jgi:peptide/nickel transport system substrate-binding protein
MLKRTWWIIAGGLVVASMLLAACGPTPTAEVIEVTRIVAGTPETIVLTATPKPPEPPEPEEPKTLVVCQGQEPDSLYVYGSSMVASYHLRQAVFDGADNGVDNRSYDYQAVITEKLPSLADGDAVIETVTVKAGDMIVNDIGDPVELAAGVVIRPAGCYSSDCAIEYDGTSEVEMERMVSTYTLVEDLAWADGTPVTARDSVYSYELAAHPDTPNPYRYVVDRTTSYEALDDRTLVWTGLPGFRYSTYFTTIWLPQPEHLWGHMTPLEIVESEEASRTPMGYGPFYVEEWVAGDHITLLKNEYYFRADEGLPKVDKVIFRVVGEDPNAAIAAALAGDCDILTQETQLGDQAELLIDLEEKGQLFPTFVTGTMIEYVSFSINPVDDYAATRPDFFEDKRMRHAIAHCLDRQAVVDELLVGRSRVVPLYVPPEHPVYYEDAEHYEYDPAAGMALLDEMGWTDEDGDGVRECNGCDVENAVDGTPLAFKWASTQASLRVNAMQIYQVSLAECGIDLTLENIPASEYFDDAPTGPLFGRHFDLGEFYWIYGSEPACYTWLSSNIATEENGWAGTNTPGFVSEEYDRACNAALQSLPGTPEYEQYHKEAQRIFAEEMPQLPLFLRFILSAYRPEVEGFIQDPTAGSAMWNIENFDLVEP